MDIKNDIKNSVKIATDAATDVVQALVDKNRLRANANRVRQVIKSDTELRNQAYIELGMYFYENMREDLDEDLEALCVVVDKTSKRIEKATKKYNEYLNRINETKLYGDNVEKLRKTAREKASVISEKSKIKAQDIKQVVKDNIADVSYKPKDKVEDIKPFIIPDEDIETLVLEQEEQVLGETIIADNVDDNTLEQTAQIIENKIPLSEEIEDEESPEEFDF